MSAPTRPFVTPHQQLCAAYRRMAQVFGERVEPGEADKFARRFWAQEDALHFDIGCPDYSDRAALVYGVTGLQALCGVERANAITLLEMAIDAIKAQHAELARADR